MENVLFVIPIDEEHRKPFEALPGYRFHFMNKEDVRPEDLDGISIVCGNLDPQLLKQCPSLKWVQLESAGMEYRIRCASSTVVVPFLTRLTTSSRIVTTSSGCLSAQALMAAASAPFCMIVCLMSLFIFHSSTAAMRPL